MREALGSTLRATEKKKRKKAFVFVPSCVTFILRTSQPQNLRGQREMFLPLKLELEGTLQINYLESSYALTFQSVCSLVTGIVRGLPQLRCHSVGGSTSCFTYLNP